MVGVSGICGTPQHEKSHRCNDVQGKGGSVIHLKKQKLDTKISTEEELVRVDELIPQILWMRYFLEAQRMKFSYNVVYQDN